MSDYLPQELRGYEMSYGTSKTNEERAPVYDPVEVLMLAQLNNFGILKICGLTVRVLTSSE
jgi:hypothetical protein